MASSTKDYHNSTMLAWLNSDRTDAKKMTDAKLVCDEREFPVHKTTLASASKFFETMFTTEMSEKYQLSFEISGMSAEKLETVLDFIYTGEIKIVKESVFDVYATANYFLMPSLENCCCNFVVPKLSPSNALSIWFRGRKSDFEVLKQKCESFMKLHFPILADDATICALDFASMKVLIALSPDDAESAEAALSHLQKWINDDLENRKQHFGDLFSLKNWKNVRGRFWVDHFKLQKICCSFPECAVTFVERISSLYQPTLNCQKQTNSILVMNEEATCLRFLDLQTNEQRKLETNPRFYFRSESSQTHCYLFGGCTPTRQNEVNIKVTYVKRSSRGGETFKEISEICNINNYHSVNSLIALLKYNLRDAAILYGGILAFNYDECTCEEYNVRNPTTKIIKSIPQNTCKALVLYNNIYLLSIENYQLILKVKNQRGVYEPVGPNLVHVSKLQDACVAHGKIVVAVISETGDTFPCEIAASVDSKDEVIEQPSITASEPESSDDDKPSEDLMSSDGSECSSTFILNIKVERPKGFSESKKILRIYERDPRETTWRFVFESTEISTYHKLFAFELEYK